MGPICSWVLSLTSCMCKDTQYTPTVCVRECVCVCGRSGKTVCQRKIRIHLECWSPWHLITKKPDLSWEIFLPFLAEGDSGSAAPTHTHLSFANGSFIENTFCPRPYHISPGHNHCNRYSKNVQGNDLLQKNNGAVFTFPFKIPLGLLCFFHIYVFLHLHSRATQGTEMEYILHYVAMTFASVFKFIILRDVLWIDRL